MGLRTVLLTLNADTVAQMSCNPAIGGVAKGQIVREIDALGGAMGKCVDASGIHYRMLNQSKGPAMHSPRAQADKKLYQFTMKYWIEQQENLTLRQELVEALVLEDCTDSGHPAPKRVAGVLARGETFYRARAVILTTGTFLKRIMHTGKAKTKGGRAGDAVAEALSDSLASCGFELARFKTGTPCRLNGRTIDFSKVEEQPGDAEPRPFSFANDKVNVQQIPCHITYTNEAVHDIIRANLQRTRCTPDRSRPAARVIVRPSKTRSFGLRTRIAIRFFWSLKDSIPGSITATASPPVCPKMFNRPCSSRSPGWKTPR